MRLQGALYQRFEAAWRGYAPPREVGHHQPLGGPRGHGPAAVEEVPPLGAMGTAGDAHRPFRVPHQPAEGDREAGGEGDDDVAVVVLVCGADVAPTAGQVANGGQTAPWCVFVVLVVGDVNRGVRVGVWQRPGWCAPGGAGGVCRWVFVGEDVQPLDAGAVLPRAVVPDVLPDQSPQRLECEVFVLRFARRQSRAESVRSPAEWGRPQVRDARAAEPVQLLRAAAAKVMPAKGVAVVVLHLHADPAWVPRPWMRCFTFGHPEEECRSQDDRATAGEGARALRAVLR